uniref:Aspartate--tRNA(Asp) ligase n=1 Tax=Staphylothermus marinus TaxID=2280 RepID=A0A7J3KEK1_STAMA
MLERICGWVIRKKIIGQIGILEISSSSVKPYVIVLKKDRDKELFEELENIDIGTAICFEGELSEKQISKRGIEYVVKKIVVYSKPIEPLPVDIVGKVPSLLETRVKYRYLLLRNPVEKAIIRIRFNIVEAARKFLVENGFIEIHTPKIVAAGAEGGATLFPIQYFENTAYLSQSPQLYKQLLVTSIPKVFEITPYFRAEKFNTVRHLNESWGIDAEIGFIDSEEDVMNILENLVAYIINYVREKCVDELEALNIDLKPVSTPFKRLTFREAVDILNSEGIYVDPNEDLSDAAEKKLGEIMVEKGHMLYFITKYPWKASGFYYMRDNNYTRKFDLDYKGLEIASGGQREHRLEKLIEAMIDKGLKPENFSFYLEAFKYGIPPHGGFGLGLERLIMKMLDLNNIREATVFVRDRTRLIP